MFLLRLLGIDLGGDVKAQDVRFRLGLPPWLILVLLLGALAYAVYSYRRQAPLGPWLRGLLAALRFAALATLFVFLLAPAAEVEVNQKTQPNVVVLLDGSISMDSRDRRTDPGDLAEAATALGKLPFADPRRQRAMARAAAHLRRSAAKLAGAGPAEARPGRAAIDEALKLAALAVAENVKDGLLPPEAPGRLQAVARQQERISLALEESRRPSEELAPLAKRQVALAGEMERLNAEWLAAGASVPEELKPGLSAVSRIALLQGILRHAELGLLRRLGRGCRLRVFRFGREIEAVGEASAEQTLRPARDSDHATYLGTALKRAVAAYAGQPVAGLVVLTDGAVTGGLDVIDAAAQLRLASVPLYTVGMGLANPDDVRLRSAAVQEVAFAKDLVRVRAHVVSSGYENRLCGLRVELDGAEVANKSFVLRGGPQIEEVFFGAGDVPGMRRLKVAVVEMPGEATGANNSVEKSLRVSDEKIEVLFIEGSPRWEYRYLRGILKRDPRMHVRFITTEGDLDVARMSREHLSRFPADKAEALKYDLVILGDARASTFSPGDFEMLDALVRERGGSLILLAGKKHIAEYVATPVAQLLPVWITADEQREVDEDVYPKLTVDGEESTLMSLIPSEAGNKALWAQVRPLGWIPPVSAAKPGATVLAELSDVSRRVRSFPLIAWHRCGSGKVLFVGTDRLFRLRQKVGDKYHRRFWSQAVQFLTLSRLLGENKRIRVEVDRTEARVGEPVEVYANALNEVYEPATDPACAVHVVAVGAAGSPAELRLEAVAGMPGLYRGTYVPRKEGRYRVVPSAKGEPSSNEALFEVRGLSSEQGETAMRRDLLARIAELTGGRHFSIAELPMLPEYLHAEPGMTAGRREVELWDVWVFPVVFLVLVSLEWALRRRQDLA